MQYDIINPLDILTRTGAKFRKVRLEKNITLMELSRRSGVATPTIQRFETSGRATLTILVRLADALELLEDFKALTTYEEPISIDAIVKSSRARKRAYSRKAPQTEEPEA